MKINISKEKVEKAAQLILPVISSKTTLPILSYVLIEAEEKIRFISTDLEVGIKTEVEGKIIQAGSLTFPGRKLIDIIRELPNEELEIGTENNSITLTCGKSFFKVYGLPPADFPKLPEVSPENVFNISQKTLKEMFSKTMFAISEQETRYILNGVYMEGGENSLKAVATDGRRLAVFTQPTSQNVALPGIVIPSKAVFTLYKILEDNENPVTIHYQQNQILFQLDASLLVARLIEGNFPKYEQLIPVNCSRVLQVNTQIFIQALRRVLLLASEHSHAVRFSIKKDGFQIFSITPEMGEASESLEGEFQGEELEITFNGRFLLDVLLHIDTENVRFEFSDSLGPGVIMSPEGKNYLCLIMPMRI
jgi:DNA polymerase-3 subunit beta